MSYNVQRGKTQERGGKTKRRLIEATKNLLGEFDFRTITLDQISQEVGVAKSSILWHFGSKEALLTESVFELFEEVDSKLKLEKSNLETLEARVKYLFTAVAEYFVANPTAKGVVITLIFNRQANGAIRDRILEQWEQHIDEVQEFLSDSDFTVSRECASSMLALMHGGYIQWFLRGRPDDLSTSLPEMPKSICRDMLAIAAAEKKGEES